MKAHPQLVSWTTSLEHSSGRFDNSGTAVPKPQHIHRHYSGPSCLAPASPTKIGLWIKCFTTHFYSIWNVGLQKGLKSCHFFFEKLTGESHTEHLARWLAKAVWDATNKARSSKNYATAKQLDQCVEPKVHPALVHNEDRCALVYHPWTQRLFICQRWQLVCGCECVCAYSCTHTALWRKKKKKVIHTARLRKRWLHTALAVTVWRWCM